MARRQARVRSRAGADARGEPRARGARLPALEGRATRLVQRRRGYDRGALAPAGRHASADARAAAARWRVRSEEQTSELQSLMRISYAVLCLRKKLTISTTYSD